jgi:hypothetical protein
VAGVTAPTYIQKSAYSCDQQASIGTELQRRLKLSFCSQVPRGPLSSPPVAVQSLCHQRKQFSRHGEAVED